MHDLHRFRVARRAVGWRRLSACSGHNELGGRLREAESASLETRSRIGASQRLADDERSDKSIFGIIDGGAEIRTSIVWRRWQQNADAS